MRKIFGPTRAGWYTLCTTLGVLATAPIFFR